MPEEIINRVARSGIITIDFQDFYPTEKRLTFDISPGLWQGLVLKENEFREFLEAQDFQVFQDAFVAVHIPEDTIIQTWAYMLIASKLHGIAKQVFIGSITEMEIQIAKEAIQKNINPKEFQDCRVVVKGCSELPIPAQAYVEITLLLQPVVKNLMFGEACSTVPVYKQVRY